jgi:uncharacterized protein (DUF1800 family)
MNFSRRDFLRAGGGVMLAVASGCEQVQESLLSGMQGRPVRQGPFQPPTADSIDLISHALNRITFGSAPGDYARVRAMGATPEDALRAFLDEQLSPEKISDVACSRALHRLETLTQPAGEMFEYKEKFLLGEMTRATLLRAVFSERQLYEVMVGFWTDHFNIDVSKGDCKWLKASDDRDVIRTHALGKFPELLRASALSPAMLWYLDGRENRRQRGDDKANENYARELMELHTLGVHGGYTQHDVMEVARCLTGWYVRSKEKFFIGKVEFKREWHDDGAKVVLGQKIPAGLGEGDLDRVLEIVALHPETARHIATKLCRKFIADEPPTAAVDDVAAAFLSSRGDIPATLRALFAADDFQSARGTKFKRPFHFVVSALRATDADTDGGEAVENYLLRMGHAPFQYPTPDGYPEQASPWLGTLLWRWNFAVAVSQNKVAGTKIDLNTLNANLGGDDRLMAHFLGRTPSDLEKQAYHDSGAGLALLLASPGFQRC